MDRLLEVNDFMYKLIIYFIYNMTDIYYGTSTVASMKEAQQYCESRGGHLTRINSQQDLDNIDKHLINFRV